MTAFLFAAALGGTAQTGTSNPAPKKESTAPAPEKPQVSSPALAVSMADTSTEGIKSAAAFDSTAEGLKSGSKTAAGDSSKAKGHPNVFIKHVGDPSENPLAYTRPHFIYDRGGKRDPFNSLVPPSIKEEKKIKGLFNYEKAALKGIVQTGSGTYALVVDGDNYAHVLRKNDQVFGGYVTDITDDAVFLHIVKYGRAMSIILRMETAKQTMRSSEEGLNLMKRPGINISFEPGAASGNIVLLEKVEDVVVPSLDTRTVEDTWFGPDPGAGEPASTSGASILISPPNASEILLPHVFRWTKAEGDSLYTLVFSEDEKFTSQRFVKEGLTGTTYLLETNPGLNPGNLYYWEIIALSRSGKWVHSRNHLSFRITESSNRGADNEKK